jgi:hypothetical protein
MLGVAAMLAVTLREPGARTAPADTMDPITEPAPA